MGCLLSRCSRRFGYPNRAQRSPESSELAILTAIQDQLWLKLVPQLMPKETSGERLFTFLRHDGVPWNNNNAEHAIKAYARARELFQGTPAAKAISEYLVLLSVCETCRNKRIDFLDFLRSGEKISKPLLRPRAGSGRTNKAGRFCKTGFPGLSQLRRGQSG